jgi:hypothetical protein
MRYEAKHRYFKQLAGVMGNFTNVAYTLAERYQRLQCLKVSPTGNNNEEFLCKPVEIGNYHYITSGFYITSRLLYCMSH